MVQETFLKAYVAWEQDGPGTAWIEFSFDPGEWHSTPSFEADAGSHEQLIARDGYYRKAYERQRERAALDGESSD